jgi:hypothetical protein
MMATPKKVQHESENQFLLEHGTENDYLRHTRPGAAEEEVQEEKNKS